ncbi:oligosaccharide flippase family protein [Dermatophilus congolensis]|uniref:oligosaccharide flippase family protein n=1 Tax=Dermatophilus congolensis TaxID=1863 RepID=UPI001AAE4420|nr:oligosaccharide flippase family protein [Dermatophilus congolensis]MBO3142994.1 oligosaccharide flippase family protein [Dermatophilus congolensis]MBO3151983.1 oligosaccharide flippase family protein [Dermatophilus congolensis]MBO3161009.1 oligosaccharide flippase family protein [Dermatophilus congolensis]MBO3163267.1 oligosaccharide flippase family protein [Dermatophilus congolensis]MBO3176824.1 oligosaccharide flippase family protein [Dermatophilus congolensis]
MLTPHRAHNTSSGRQVSSENQKNAGTAKTLMKGMSWQTSCQLIPLIVNLAMTPWIIHGLGPARYSIFMLVTSFTTLLSQFDGGIGPSAMRYFTIYAGRDDRESTTRLLLSVAAIVFTGGLIISLTVFLTTESILQFFRVDPLFLPEASFLLRTLTMIIAFILVRNLLNAVINARQLFRYTSMAILAGYGVYIVGITASIMCGWGLYGLAWTMVMQQVVGSIITVPAAVRYLRRATPWHMNRADLGEFFRYSWKVQITGLTGLLTSQKDQLVAGRLLSAQQSGPIGQGTNFAQQLRQMPLNATYPMQALTGTEVARVGSADAVAKIEKLQRIWVRAIVGWCVIGAIAALFAVRAWLPDSFTLAAPVAAAFIFGSVFQLIRHVANLWCLTLGHSEIEMHAGVASFIVNVVLSVVLYFPFGVGGVVAATVLAQLASVLFFSWQYHSRVPVRPRLYTHEVPFVGLVAGVGVAVAVEWLVHPFLPRGALGLLSGALLAAPGMLVYLVLAFNKTDLATAKDIFRRTPPSHS